MENQALQVMEPAGALQQQELTVEDIVAKIQKVKDIQKAVLKKDIHFGTIPGTPKPSLYKPGAEILNMTFRLTPRYEGEREPIDLGNGHREYVIRCELFHIHTGTFYGSGVGSCSTLESKYRYRPGPVEPTGRPVPGSYWDMRKTDPAKALELLGGKGFVTKKVDGRWEICRAGEVIENPNLADQYNTVLKMAAKRAYIDATLKANCASEVFTQDLEDMRDNDDARQGKGNDEDGAPPTDAPPTPPAAAGPGPACPKCGAPTRRVPAGTGKNGKPYDPFWSCTTFPKCDGVVRNGKTQTAPAQTSAPPQQTSAPDPGEGAPFPDGDPWAGQEPPPPTDETQPATTAAAPPYDANGNSKISEGQRRRMYGIWKKAKFADDQAKAILQACGYAASGDVLRKHYDKICESFEIGTPEQTAVIADFLGKWCKEN